MLLGAVRALILQRVGLSLSGCQLGWVEGVEQHSSMSRMKIRLMRLTRIVGLVVGVGTIKDSHFVNYGTVITTLCCWLELILKRSQDGSG